MNLQLTGTNGTPIDTVCDETLTAAIRAGPHRADRTENTSHRRSAAADLSSHRSPTYPVLGRGWMTWATRKLSGKRRHTEDARTTASGWMDASDSISTVNADGISK